MTPDIDKSLERSQRWLKENIKRYAFKKLEREIIKTGVCTECGTCVANCPVDAISGIREKNKYVPKLTGKCIACGICYEMCPRTITLSEDLIGHYRSAWKARSVDLDGNKQDGGVVSALLYYALKEGIVDAAVAACQSKDIPWLPEATTISKPDKALECAGTIYTHAPVVDELMSALRGGNSATVVVGTSCNLDGITQLQEHPGGTLNTDLRSSVLKIGLFCMESFDYNGLVDFLRTNEVDIKDVRRMAIAKGKFKVLLDESEKEWPVSDLDSIASTSCSYCHDLTTKQSDISCGNIGSGVGWTTVLVRTERGEHLFQEAVDSGVIEAEPLEEKPIQIIINVARSKAMRCYSMEPSH